MTHVPPPQSLLNALSSGRGLVGHLMVKLSLLLLPVASLEIVSVVGPPIGCAMTVPTGMLPALSVIIWPTVTLATSVADTFVITFLIQPLPFLQVLPVVVTIG